MASRKKHMTPIQSAPQRVGRLTPIAVAVSVVLGGGASVADAGVAVRMAMPAIRPGSINTSNLVAPVSTALPKPIKDLKDQDGKAQNIATSGNTTGILDDAAHTLRLDQDTAKAIVPFASWDVGSAAAVSIYMKAVGGGSAMYQVSNSSAPSQVYGAVSSYINVGTADAPKYQQGGEIFLINQNGILFGRGAQVNVGSLFGSALALDEADFLSGLGSIQKAAPTFMGGDTYAPEKNFVKVDVGAELTTSSGGRVFLLGGQVENAGSIKTPQGQTVLAAGKDVYLADPTGGTNKLYMSESNPNVPTVKGLLVEVNSDAATLASEFATNSGTINSPTGNTTIVGWAVNQRGRISATTSVTQNGSVYLLARSGTQAEDAGTTKTKFAKKGGTLTLDEGSRIDILPDNTPDANGKPPTTTAGSVFTSSRVELSGRTVEFKDNATIVAPNATVNVRAATAPVYASVDLQENGSKLEQQADANAPVRIVMGAGSAIDVAGTQNTSASVARNFVQTDLLGYQDLKDAPMQKDGPLYRSKVTLDIRQSSPILGDLQSYRDAVIKSVDEFMSAGGKVTLSSSGSVAMHPTARLDVSGGKVTYTEATVAPTILVAEDGQRFTLNTAPSDVKYVAIAGKEAPAPSRFGAVKAGNANVLGQNEAGYVEGKAAGTLSVYAPVALLDGQLKGATVVGERQKAGTDAMAASGSLNLGASVNQFGPSEDKKKAIGSGEFSSAVMTDLQITAKAASADGAFWDGRESTVERDLSDQISRVSAAQINASGFGNINVATNHGIEQQAGANLNLVDRASVNLQTAAMPVKADAIANMAAGVVLGGSTRSVGGAFNAVAFEGPPPASDERVDVGVVRVKAGNQIDMSGNWVNQRLDGNTVAAAASGGNISLSSDHGLIVEDHTKLNVSGGVTVTKAGNFVGTKAGSIKLAGLNKATGTPDDQVHIGADLQGFSMSQGGSLSIKAGDITVADAYTGLSQGAGIASLNVGSDFFSQGGFQSYTLDGRNKLLVKSNTQIQPKQVIWQALASARNAATGSDVARMMTVDRRAETVRKPMSLSLNSTGANTGEGQLVMETGSSIHLDALGSVALSAAQSLNLDGQIITKGGKISTTVQLDSGVADFDGDLVLGEHALLDVSGDVVYTPNSSGLLTGSVVDGGSIFVGVNNPSGQSNAAVKIESGVQLLADGAVAPLDVARLPGGMGPAYTRQAVASNGGDINIQLGLAGGALNGKVSAKAGSSKAKGGTFTVGLGTGSGKVLKHEVDTLNTIHVKQSATPTAAQAHQVTLSADAIRDGGFENLYVSSLDRVQFDGDVNLDLAGHLRVDSPVVRLNGANSHVALHGGSTAQVGSTGSDSAVLSGLRVAEGGTSNLAISGGLVELMGWQAMQGVGDLSIQSGSELRLRGVSQSESVLGKPGQLDTAADVNIQAKQVVPTTASEYTINAMGKKVVISGGDASAQTPLSAGSSLTINAATIEQNGVIKAPFGTITLNATDAITLGKGSVTSVSGEDLLVPFGATTGGGAKWTYGNAEVSTFKDKVITLNAEGKKVDAQSGATLNLNGGGKMVGWEFVSGPGGSKDIFVGAQNGAFAIVPAVKDYAPGDHAILAAGGLSQNPMTGNVLSLGNTVTFGPGGPIAAGTYAVLPAQYALLPGAFLVKPASTAVSMGYTRANADGSYLVGAMTGVSGTAAAGNAQPKAFTVMSSEVARRYSEINNTYTDDFAAKKAAESGAIKPALAADAGRLSVVAAQLQLDAQIQFQHAAGKRGGQLDIASSDIHVGDPAGLAKDVLNLTYEQLNRSGADSIMLGAVRQQTNKDGSVDATVKSQSVTVDSSVKSQSVTDDSSAPQVLSVGDIILAAKDVVTLGKGASIVAADGGVDSSSLNFKGDGALLRVSHDAAASSKRTGKTGETGRLVLGEALNLQGGAITAEATQSTEFTKALDTKSTIKADKVVVGAARIEVGGHDAKVTEPSLVVSGRVLEQLSAVKDLTLRSFSSLDVLGSNTIGGDKARNLTLDAAQILVKGEGSQVKVLAGGVNLLNTTDAQPAGAQGGTGQLNVVANGLNGGTGHITIGQGAVAVSGVAATNLQAAGSVVMSGQGGLTVPGNLTMEAQSLTAQQAANGKLVAQDGTFQLRQASGAAVAATSGVGANLDISAKSVAQDGRIDLASGKLAVTAGQSVVFGGASKTNLAGLAKKIDGKDIATVGGDLKVSALTGDIRLDQGGVLDVSAGLGNSQAGSMTFSATQGSVDLNGRVLAQSTDGQKGGVLKVDAKKAVDVAALAKRIADETAAGVSNFGRSIELRNREGDLRVQASALLSSQKLTLTSDSGKLLVDGHLHANGDAGGQVNLNAGQDVIVSDGADIQAKALKVGGAGGSVAIHSSQGDIQLNGGTLDLSGNGASDGVVSLRAMRTEDGVAIAPIGSTLTGVQAIQAEAVQRYDATDVDQGLIGTVKAEANDYLAANLDNIKQTLTASQPDLMSKLDVRTGVEFRSDADMTIGTAGPVNLTTYTSKGAPSNRGTVGDVTNWTFLAAKDLNVLGSVSEGFSSAGVAQKGSAGNMALVGGADLTSSDVKATVASTDGGDVKIGAGGVVSVRNTVGSIDVVAGRDVVLANNKATVYTTGRPVDLASEAIGYVQPKINVTGVYQKDSTAPFLTGGGNVSVQAQQDVSMWIDDDVTPQFVTDWWYRWKNAQSNNQLSWFSRYDLFKQGVATFGGGNVDVSAGRNANNVNAAAVSSGSAVNGQNVNFGGGSVAVQAGGDVVGGVVMASRDIHVLAGGQVKRADQDITPESAQAWSPSLQVVYGSGNVDVLARGDVTVGRLAKAGQYQAKKQGSGLATGYSFYLYEKPSEAEMVLSSTGGDLTLDGITPDLFRMTASATTLLDTATLSAAAGSVQLGLNKTDLSTLIMQDSGQKADLSILAAKSITLHALLAQADMRGSVQSTTNSALTVGGLLGAPSYIAIRNGGQDRTPVRIVAEQGDVSYEALIGLTQGLRMMAGRDIVAESKDTIINVQHQDRTEVSLIQAGRDLKFATGPAGVGSGGITLGGPGELIVVAGRNIDLANSYGLETVGNLRNSSLKNKGSANITVLTGVDFAKGDVTDAVNAFYPLLGGQGVAAQPDVLFTQIKVQQAVAAVQARLASDGAPHTPEQVAQAVATAKAQAQSDAAAAWRASSDWLSLARGLAGDATYQQLAAGYVNHRVDGTLVGADAVKAFEALPVSDKNQVAAQLLAKVWAGTVPADERLKTVMSMVGTNDASRMAALRSFLATRQGLSSFAGTDKQAWEQFAQLPPEQQALLVTRQLSDEVASVIADAASKTGAARDAAYGKAYQAMLTVFPNVTELPASLNMGASKIKTYQSWTHEHGDFMGASERVMSPNGGVNVGQLIGDGKQDADLGMVTAGGGDISVLTRDNVAVNTSRIFTLVKGDEVIWSSLGNVDAGRGAKTVTSTPSPVYYLDEQGQLQIDVSSAISGSGISATGLARIAAPKGEINAGDAGISATGGLDLAANVIRGADAIVSPVVRGAPPAPAVNMAVSAATPTQPTAAGASDANSQDDDKKKKKRKRSVLLDFLGFGSEDSR